MKQVSMAVILISALTLTLVSTAIFSGVQQVRAENDKEDDNTQVNTERKQINNCENNSQNQESKSNVIMSLSMVLFVCLEQHVA